LIVPKAKGWFLTVRKNPAYSVLSGVKEMVEAAGIEPFFGNFRMSPEKQY